MHVTDRTYRGKKAQATHYRKLYELGRKGSCQSLHFSSHIPGFYKLKSLLLLFFREPASAPAFKFQNCFPGRRPQFHASKHRNLSVAASPSENFNENKYGDSFERTLNSMSRNSATIMNGTTEIQDELCTESEVKPNGENLKAVPENGKDLPIEELSKEGKIFWAKIRGYSYWPVIVTVVSHLLLRFHSLFLHVNFLASIITGPNGRRDSSNQ